MEALSNFFLTSPAHCGIVTAMRNEMRNFATVRNIGTRLRKGMRVQMEGVVYEVTLVNESRAHVEPVEKTRTVVIEEESSNTGEKKVFQARRRGFDISPNSEVEILPQ